MCDLTGIRAMRKPHAPSLSGIAGYVGLFSGLALLFWLFVRVDIAASYALVLDIGWLSLLVLLPYGGLHLFETLGWARLMPVLHAGRSFRKLFGVQLSTETLSMTVPAGVALGEPLRPWLCRRVLNIAIPVGIAGVAVRKLVLGLSQGIYSLAAAVWGFSFLEEVSHRVIGVGGLGWMVVAAAGCITILFALLIFMLLNGSAARWLHRVLMGLAMKRVRSWLLEKERSFHETDHELSRLRAHAGSILGTSVLLYTLSWMMLPLEAWLILRLLGAEVSFPEAFAFDTALTLMRSVVFFIPSGLGIQDFGYLAFFRAMDMSDYLVTGGAFVLLRRFKELLWYFVGYVQLVLQGIRPSDARSLSGNAVS
ncbi:MAG: lysylphosphatidylglycerol synthase transmembrane domain-containing protein [Prosthecochloris sp.]|nr:lysylphosphatidylglycerol synthase transmembrane domain-containing protein [Prosthecochloris sp.]